MKKVKEHKSDCLWIAQAFCWQDSYFPEGDLCTNCLLSLNLAIANTPYMHKVSPILKRSK
jgi:hypothetical protein